MKVSVASAQYSILIAGHGSRDIDGLSEFEALVELISCRSGQYPVTHAYLEFAEPTIDLAVRKMVAEGARRIVMLPALLGAATHAKNDMPSELLYLAGQFPDIEFHFGAAMDLHPLLLQLCQKRIVEAEARAKGIISRRDTCLVVVGRGTSDPDANSDVTKLSRMLEEGMGFGASFVCYAGTARPAVRDGLKRASRLGFKKMIVLPYMLFDGVLVKRIYAAADGLQACSPGLEVLKAGYLGVTEEVADVFLGRAHEGAEGRAHMNCSLCKYRVPIVGFEPQVGEMQKAHQGKGAVKIAPAVRGSAALQSGLAESYQPYEPHPIEAESFRIIQAGRDWSAVDPAEKLVLQRLVHTSGDFGAVDDIFMSPGAVEAGIRALLRCRIVVCDVTMVASGLKRSLLDTLGIFAWCGVHDRETRLLAESHGITRSAAGIRRAWQTFGNDAVVAIGDAPTAVAETVRLVKEQLWRPQLVIGLPVGFVGTREAKVELRQCLPIPRITNAGFRGGSPWAAAVVNALMIGSLKRLSGAP